MNPTESVLHRFSLRYGPYETFHLLKAVAAEANNWDLARRYGLSIWNVRLLKADPSACLRAFTVIIERHYAKVVPAREILRA